MGDQPEIKLYRGRWYAVWVEGGKTQRRALRASASERELAERNYHDWVKTPQGETVGDIMKAYLAEKDQTAAHPARLHFAWDKARGSFGFLRPDQITRERCRDYASRRYREGVGPATVRKELQVIRAALGWAERRDGAKFDFPKAPPPRDRHLSRQEYQRLLDSCGMPHVRLFCLLALNTGARASAILELEWARVDLDSRRISYERQEDGKPRKKRATAPINETLHTALVEARRGAETGWVVEYAGDRVRSIKRGFRAACERAGLEDVTPHVLRHTCAVWLAEAGLSMSEIAQFLGHTDSRITERVYARYSPKHLEGVANVLG